MGRSRRSQPPRRRLALVFRATRLFRIKAAPALVRLAGTTTTKTRIVDEQSEHQQPECETPADGGIKFNGRMFGSEHATRAIFPDAHFPGKKRSSTHQNAAAAEEDAERKSDPVRLPFRTPGRRAAIRTSEHPVRPQSGNPDCAAMRAPEPVESITQIIGRAAAFRATKTVAADKIKHCRDGTKNTQKRHQQNTAASNNLRHRNREQ